MDIRISSLAEIASALRAKEISATELCETAIANHRNELNAYREWAPEKARAQAQAADRAFGRGEDLGPFHGIPVSIKDNYGVPGYGVYAGTPRALPASWQEPGPIVEKIIGQSAVVMGKTHTVEFAMGTLGANDHWGAPVNPWDAAGHRAPGGSSAGAGVSILEGSALVAFGSDTAGSIRCPASMTGCVGYKASNGRWPTAGIVPLSTTLDVPGPLTRSVTDLAHVWCTIEDAAPLETTDLADHTIGIADDFFWRDCSAGVGEAVRAAIDQLSNSGAKLVAAPIACADDAFAMSQQGGIAAYEFAQFIDDQLAEWKDHVSPWIAQRIAAGRAMPRTVYDETIARMDEWRTETNRLFDKCDVIACPTTPLTPPRFDQIEAPEDFRHATLLNLRNTTIANLLDMAAITIPVGKDAAGMPVGLQLMAKAGDDRRLIEIARGVEAKLGKPRERIGEP